MLVTVPHAGNWEILAVTLVARLAAVARAVHQAEVDPFPPRSPMAAWEIRPGSKRRRHSRRQYYRGSTHGTLLPALVVQGQVLG